MMMMNTSPGRDCNREGEQTSTKTHEIDRQAATGDDDEHEIQ